MLLLRVTLIAAFAAAGLCAAQTSTETIVLKGVHLCCGTCGDFALQPLKKVEGVSDGKYDVKAKTVTFTAKDDKAAAAGVKALVDAGFFGEATSNGKPLKVVGPTVKPGKADIVTVKGVHDCCSGCVTDIDALFKGAKVTHTGKAPQRDLRIVGKDLDRAKVLESLQKAGLSGTVE